MPGISRYTSVLLLTVIAVLATPVASACSVVEGYHVPTNLELVEQAELIMLGRVIGQNEIEDAPWESGVLVQPITAVRGTLPNGVIAIAGTTLAVGRAERFGILSNLYKLEAAHPASYIGGCVRYIFPQDTTVLFFLDTRDGTWVAAGGAFSRWAEDVLTDDAPWLRLSRFYAEVASLPQDERAAMLLVERDRYVAQADNPVARLMMADIERQIAGPNSPANPQFYGENDASDELEDIAEGLDSLEVTVTEGDDGYSLEGTVEVSRDD